MHKIRIEIPALEIDIDALASLVAERVDELLVGRQRPSPLLTPPEVANYLGCARQRVYDLCSTGKLKSVKDGGRLLIRRSDLERYLEGEPPNESPEEAPDTAPNPAG